MAEKVITKVYPMDSAEIKADASGVLTGDRMFNSADLRELHGVYFTDGVVADFLDELKVSQSGTSWTVGAGSAIAAGLLITNDDAATVLSNSDIPSGQYAYVFVRAEFDRSLRDGRIGYRLSSSASEQPVRTESVHELILARVNWRGQMTDLRLDPAYCGPLSFRYPVDTDSFMAELATAVSQFDLAPGDVSALPAGATPTVSVRKPPVYDGTPVYVDFGIPMGERGPKGADGHGVILQPGQPDAPTEGDLWIRGDPGTRVIDQISHYEVAGTYPGEVYPGEAYPGGTARFISYTIDPALVKGPAATGDQEA